MVVRKIGNISYRLREDQDFSWIGDYGTVFSVIDETGSGCILFGLEKDGKKYFAKIAGAKTIETEVSPEESVRLLKDAVQKYRDIRNENLVRYVDSFEKDGCFAVVFEYAEGECLFDHWNFDRYAANGPEESPGYRFKKLPAGKRLAVAEKLFAFLRT